MAVKLLGRGCAHRRASRMPLAPLMAGAAPNHKWAMSGQRARIGVDIGGTFTDVVLERGETRHSIKVLTTAEVPEEGVLDGIAAVMKTAGLAPSDVGLIIHGTTLITNALITRKGAKTALVTTEGFRYVLEMGTESRFEQYDLAIEKP